MSDTANEAPNGPQNGEGQAPALAVNGQYIKDLSFESPNSPAIFNALQNGQPDLNINVDLGVTKLEEQANVFEVLLTLGGEMKVGDQVGFIIELKYAGIFTINVPEEHLKPILMIECPRLLFPFARSIISDATRDGGFMPLTLQPIDFAQLYQASLQQEAEGISADVEKMVGDKDNKKKKNK